MNSRLLILLGLFLFGSTAVLQGQGAIIYVDANAATGGNGQSWATAYDDLKEALYIGNYQAGDTIWVAAGTYYPTTTTDRDSTFQLRNNLAIFGGFLPGDSLFSQRDWSSNATILSGDIGTANDTSDNSYHVVSGWFGNNTAVLDGFTIIGGNANGGGWVNGGGMWNFSSPGFTGPLVRNCAFKGNYARSNGGAVYNFENSASFINCWFENNVANEGGAIFNGKDASSTIQDCFFGQDSARSYGGAIHAFLSSPSIINCRFEANHAGFFGGAIHFRSNPSGQTINGEFRSNTSTEGGAIYIETASNLRFYNCLFSGNRAAQNGGGVYTIGFSSNPTFVNCTIAHNRSSLAGGVDIKNFSSPTFYNTIAYGNRTSSGSSNHLQQINGSALTLVNCIVENLPNGQGVNTSSANPLFESTPVQFPPTSQGDFRVKTNSPAIDSGNPQFLPVDLLDLDEDGDVAELLPVDLDKEDRIQNQQVDIGAYETFSLCAGGNIQLINPDTAFICAGDSFVAYPGSWSSYLWFDGSLDSTLSIDTAGLFWVEVRDLNGCSFRDTFWVDLNPTPVPDIEPLGGTTACRGSFIGLRAKFNSALFPNPTYTWSNGAILTATNRIQYFYPDTLVWVEIESAKGCAGRDTLATPITFYPLPNPDLGPDTLNLCEGQNTTLDAGPFLFGSYKWQAGATTIPGATSQTLTVDTTNRYIVTVVDSNLCSNMDTIQVMFNANPRLDSILPAQRIVICSGDSVRLAAGVFDSYTWSTGVSTPSIRVSQAGFYGVRVANIYGCTDTATSEVIVNTSPIAFIDTVQGTLICPGDSISIQANGNVPIQSYLWSTNDTTRNIFVKNAGTYKVTITDANGCDADAEVVTRAAPLLNPDISVIFQGGSSVFCEGDTITLDAGVGAAATYNWSTNDITPQIRVTNGGIYWVEVTAPNGCIERDTTMNLVRFPTPNPTITGNNKVLCTGDTLILGVSPAFPSAIFRWTGNVFAQTLDVTTGGSYSVTITDAVGCVGSDTTVVTQVPTPIPQIDTLGSGRTTFCEGDSVTLDGGIFPAYVWSGGQGGNTQFLTAKTTDQYILTVIDANQCEGRDTVQVTVHPNPVLTLAVQDTNIFCEGDSATILANMHPFYQWSTGEIGSQITVDSSGTYLLLVSDNNGCIALDSARITVHPNPTPVFVPANPFVCIGDTTTLTVTPTYQSYDWTGGFSTPSVSLFQGGWVQVSVTDINTCETTDSVFVDQFNKPVPTISSNVTSVCEGDTIDLTANAGYVSYLWSTGDTTQSIRVTFGGIYWVEVMDANGCPGRDSMQVSILPNPIPNIIPFGRTDLCQGDSVILSSDTFYTFYDWSSGANTQSIVAKTAGKYWLEVTDANGCKGTDSLDISVSNFLEPMIQVSGGSTTICDGDSVNLLVGTYDTYAWGFGNDTTTVSTNNSIKIGASGSYWVRVATSNGCSGVDTVMITVVPELTPMITASGSLTFCEGDSVILDAGGPFANYRWNGNNNLNTQTIVAKTTGNYLVEVTDGNGCQGISSRFVRVFPNPTQGITPNKVGNDFCEGDTVQLYGGNSAIYPSIVWSTGSNNDTIFVTRTGLFSVTVTDTNGCSVMDTLQLNFFANPQPMIAAGGPLVVCQGDSLTLDAGSYTSYLWSTGLKTSNIHVTQGGQYEVTVIDANGCSGSDTVVVNTGLPPNLSISPPGPLFLCPDRSQTLTAGNFSDYLWSTGAMTPTITVMGRDSGLYYVTVVDTNGCEATDSIEIKAYQVDTVQIVTNPNILVACSADSLTLTATGNFSTYQWSTGDSTRTILPPPDPNDLPRVYTVFVTDANGCQDIGVTVVTIKQTTFASFTGLDTAYCDNDTALVPLVGTPPGFTFLGPGINPGGNFRPSDAGPGAHDILYALTSSNGCKDTATLQVTVFPVGGNPDIMISDTLCNNELLDPLMATPVGGTFSGPGVFQDNGRFKLAADSLMPNASYTINYGYGVAGVCFNLIQDSFYVKPVTPAFLSVPNNDFDFCLLDGPVTLTSAPLGGMLSCATCGSGLFSNLFIPNQAGVGVHEILYVTVNGDCPDTARIILTVNDLPSLTIDNRDTVFCESDPLVNLLATPSGGTFLGGPYIQNGQFNPSPIFTTPGVNTVSYFYADPNTGCTNLISKDFIVNPLPAVSILSPGLQSFCPDGTAIPLSATPAGGMFSGVGIRDSNIFDPVLADTGAHEILYTFTDTNQCTNQGKITLSVNPITGMGFAGLDSSYCQGQGQIDLTTVTTPVSGGIKSFFGPPVLNNRLLSTNRPANTYTIGYIYTDLSTPAQCKDTLYTLVRLDTIPKVSFLTASGAQLSDEFCFSGGLATTLQGFPASGGDSKFLGMGIQPPSGASSVVYDPSLAGLGIDTVAYIFTDNNGCADTAFEYIDIMMRPNTDILNYNDTDVVSFCLGDTISQVFTGTPANGQFWRQPPDTTIFTPTGFFTNMRFDPVVYGPGRHALQYIYDTQVPGCRDSSFLTAYVFDKQDAVFSGLEDGYCITDSIDIPLSAVPDVGSRAYLINGVEAQFFNPKIVGIGTHIVGFAYEIEGCPDTLLKTVVVRGKPTVSFSGLDSIFCSDGNAVSLTGMPEGGRFFGNGIVGNSNIFNPMNASTGSSLTVQYAYVDGFGCTDTASLTTIVYPTPDAQVSVAGENSPDPFYLCLNEDIIFTSPIPGSFDYFWDINDEETSTLKTVRYRFDSPGLKRINHVLTLQAGGCSDTITETIFINPLPEAIMQGDSIIYLGDQGQYMNLSDEKYDFEWLFSDSLVAGISPVSYFFSDTGYQDIMLAIEDTTTRCTDTTTFQSLVVFRPNVEFVQGLYPNPTRGEVNINIKAEAGVEIEIHIFDATGKFIFKELFPPLDSGLNRLKLDLRGLPDGVYALLIMEGDERSDFGSIKPSLFSRFGIDYYKFRKVILIGE